MPCPVCTATAIATTLGQIGAISVSARAVQRKMKETKQSRNTSKSLKKK